MPAGISAALLFEGIYPMGEITLDGEKAAFAHYGCGVYTTYYGRSLAVLLPGSEEIRLTVTAEGMTPATLRVAVRGLDTCEKSIYKGDRLPAGRRSLLTYPSKMERPICTVFPTLILHKSDFWQFSSDLPDFFAAFSYRILP